MWLMAKTLTPAPTDRSMWRRLLRVVHPDTGGEHDLFIWTSALQEHVVGDQIEEPRGRRDPSGATHYQQTERVDFAEAFNRFASHEELTRHALKVAESGAIEGPYRTILGLLRDCYPAAPTDTPLPRAEHQGASYKQLAYIGHLAGMDGASRMEFYRVAEAIPLSQRHAGHLISRLQQEAA
jgi:hypothetical protein